VPGAEFTHELALQRFSTTGLLRSRKQTQGVRDGRSFGLGASNPGD
jgi:hypothetical protein